MRKSSNIIHRFLLLLLFFSSIFVIPAKADEKPPNIDAQASVLMDADTGQILYSKNGNEKHFPASTTKVLTALVVLEKTNLTDIVTVGPNPPFAEGSSIGLKEGEKLTVEDLLTGLLLESGNDCAEALAEHVAGSTEAFAKMMNEKAKEIGCTDSNFENPSGLPNDKHVTTAYDLALILKEAIKNPDFVRISRKISMQLSSTNLEKTGRWVNNHNHLINKNSKYYYEYALAGKSGYTDVARQTFVISAKKDGRTLVASFLKAEDKNKNFEDMPKLLEYGFNNFTQLKLYSKDDVVENIPLYDNTTIPIKPDKDILYSAPNSNLTNINKSLEYTLPRNITRKSLKKGETIATANVLVDGTVISKVNLVSDIDREYNFKVAMNQFYNKHKVATIIIPLIIILIIILIIRIIYVKRKRKTLAFNKKWAHMKNRKK